jgi:hypothetical protein
MVTRVAALRSETRARIVEVVVIYFGISLTGIPRALATPSP